MNKIKYSLIGIALFVLLGYGMGLQTKLVGAFDAVGTYFGRPDCYTAAATSTLAYMTPGTATTTVTCVMGQSGGSSAILNVIVNATSTNTLYRFVVEESMDGDDWFTIATTTPNSSWISDGYDSVFTYIFASSTVYGATANAGASLLGVDGTNNRNHFSIDIPVRMKQVRVRVNLPINAVGVGATTTYRGALWMQIVPKINNY